MHIFCIFMMRKILSTFSIASFCSQMIFVSCEGRGTVGLVFIVGFLSLDVILTSVCKVSYPLIFYQIPSTLVVQK